MWLGKGDHGMDVMMGDLVLTEPALALIGKTSMRRGWRRSSDSLKEMGATINARIGLNQGLAQQRPRRRGHSPPHDRDAAERDLPHYWGKGPAQRLATGVRAAVDQLGKAASH